MTNVFFDEKEENKGEKGGSWHERRAFQLERDGKMIGLVNHFEVVTCDLVVALLGLQRTTVNRNIVERRLRRLAAQGHFNQITQDGITYSVTLAIHPRKKTERTQLAHRLMEARLWGTLERALSIADKRTGRMLWVQGGTLIPDGFCTIGTQGFFWEHNSGRDHFDQILTKSALYDRNYDYLAQHYFIESFRVVWISKLKGRVAHMVESLKGIGSGALFLVTHEDAFSPYEPASILQPIFISPHDSNLHSLLEA